MASSSASSSWVKADAETPQDQVFINFRGDELRYNFVSHLEKGLKRKGINAFIDTDEEMGQELNVLLERIQGSRIALAIFSPRYTESKWCLKELAKMKQRREQNKLVVVPIFYKVQPDTVKELKGDFGDNFRQLVKPPFDKKIKKEWKEALQYVPFLTGIVLDDKSDEDQVINIIIKKVKEIIQNRRSEVPPAPNHSECIGPRPQPQRQKRHESLWGIEHRLKQLEEKLSFGSKETTRTIGVAGMPGIGKTTLATMLYEKWNDRFLRHVLILDIHKTSEEDGLDYLATLLLQGLLKVENPNIESVEAYRDQLLETKVLVVLDNVSSKEQIDALLGKRDWIKKGSKIVITTSDKSLMTQSLVNDTYQVPPLSDKDALKHFLQYAFDDHEGDAPGRGNFPKLSKDFVHYTKGNPLALQMLGAELLGKDETHWGLKLNALLNQHHKSPPGQSISKMLQRVWEGSYDGLSQKEKDTLLDIACFRSLDESYVASLLDSDGSSNIIEDLVNKFMINIYAGKVEMDDTLYMLSKELGREATAKDRKGRHRLWHHHTITDVLTKNKGASNVRSIFLDLSDITREMCFHNNAFASMRDLRYLKIYSTQCPQECESDIKLNFPEGLQLPLNEVRYLHWLKFPLTEVPQDLTPDHLVDLKLPYSEIERVWEDNKDASKLKWINLNHSKKLNTLAGLGKARNLQELNLEGCTALKELHVDMENMKCLVSLNLRRCTSLESLSKIKLISLKTLILSDCSKLKTFQVISDKLEALHLDGTAIKDLPCDIRILQRLVLLNMKGCKKLKRLPESLGELKALEELVLFGCIKLEEFPKSGENLSRLEILVLDETSIEEIPEIVSVRHLCLSMNKKISCLPDLIKIFSQLQWLDLKYCKTLTHVPQLPPNLQCLDVRGCSLLKTLAKPLVCSTINSTFIFTYCNELEQDAKEKIVAYAERKCQLLSSALKRCDKSCVPEIFFSTSFPGCEMPSWFCHNAIGSMVEFELPPHWNHNRLSGIALCVVVSFKISQNHANLTVRFSCEQTTGEGSSTSITWKIGSLIEHYDEVDPVESDHVIIGYTNCSDFIKPVKGQGPSQCAPTKASIEFSVTADTGEEARFEVLKSGFSFVFEPEENKVAVPRNDDVKGNTKVITLSNHGCFKDQANGDESPKDHWQTTTYIESSLTYIPDEAYSS
ncbi:PREDICTED: LOW QUALITY PROTEIN: disease resistance-like protein CSA1 [Camelina sativa]|uniref:ADP-ribosyl cyclase/cyclic ADP-ribose hydrolase n=1 Tax=Camelina sativa TaxID=90675 RepID=A0ABM0XYB7_CAMSA|nr:PREDICTED: LOW QUALITY PROTEIN: disease resistance-like protein CSA1 [Camelina sativa]